MDNTELQQGSSRPAPQKDCLSPLTFAILLGWIILVAYGRVIVQLLSSLSPGSSTRQLSLLLSAGEIVLLGIPLFLVASFWRNQSYLSVFRTWSWAVAFTLLLVPVQLSGLMDAQAKACLQILLSGVFIAAVLLRGRLRSFGMKPLGGDNLSRRRLALALLIAAFVTYPWLAWGALGSLLDTTLEILATLSIGVAAGVLLERVLLRPSSVTPAGFAGAHFNSGEFFRDGLSIGATLLIIASGLGFSFGGMQLLLMLVWPALGWALIGLALLAAPGATHPKAVWLPLAALIGLAGMGPMAFIDANELALVVSITPGEILHWALQAVVVSVLIGLVSGLLLSFFLSLSSRKTNLSPGQASSRTSRFPVAVIFGGFALFAWLAGAVIYFSTGHPGLYGERMFVVLRNQPDLSAARSIKDYNQRRLYVYQTLVANANTSQTSLRQTLEKWGLRYTPYYLVNGLELPANPFLRLWLANRPEVDRVLDSPQLRPLPASPPVETGTVKDAPTSPAWNLTNIGADRVWNELHVTGQGVVVGQSDSGVDGNHPDLAHNYRGKDGQNDYNWFDPWNKTTHPTDAGGHGTHTLGTVLGAHTGVAPGATWIACVNLARNLGNPAVYLDCMQFMLAPFPLGGDPFKDGDPARGAMVLNDSWGCPAMEGCDANALLPAVYALRMAGVFVEASAGNDGPECKTLTDPPALYADVFSTGAINSHGLLADFSSRGPVTADGSNRVKPDIVAPGVDVFSAMPGNTYGSMSGTSMAGPHVVGVVALMWSANPSLIGDIDRTEQILRDTAAPYTGTLPTCPGADGKPSTAVGYGIVDAYAAVKAALAAR